MTITDISFATYGRSICTNRIFPERATGTNKLYYINSGSISCKISNKTHLLKEGHLYLIPQKPDIILTAENVDHTFFDFFTAPIIMNTDIIGIELSEYPMLKAHFEAVNMSVQKHPMCKFGKDTIYYDFTKRALMNLLLLINEHFEILMANNSIINQAITYIHSNYHNKITISELSDMLHVEKSTFIRMFKKHTNTTPYQYIKNLRITIAHSLIKEGTYTLSEIASLVGYSDAATLSHSIKKR